MILAIDGCLKKLQILVALLKICKFVIQYFPFLLYMHHLKVFKYFILFWKSNIEEMQIWYSYFSSSLVISFQTVFGKLNIEKMQILSFYFVFKFISKMERFPWHLKISLFTFTNCSLLGNILPLSLSLIINKFIALLPIPNAFPFFMTSSWVEALKCTKLCFVDVLRREGNLGFFK